MKYVHGHFTGFKIKLCQRNKGLVCCTLKFSSKKEAVLIWLDSFFRLKITPSKLPRKSRRLTILGVCLAGAWPEAYQDQGNK